MTVDKIYIYVPSHIKFILETLAKHKDESVSAYMLKILYNHLNNKNVEVSSKTKKAVLNAVRLNEQKSTDKQIKRDNHNLYWGLNAKRKILNFARAYNILNQPLDMRIIREMINNELKRYRKMPEHARGLLYADKNTLELWRKEENLNNALTEVAGWIRTTSKRIREIDHVENLPGTMKRVYTKLDEDEVEKSIIK